VRLCMGWGWQQWQGAKPGKASVLYSMGAVAVVKQSLDVSLCRSICVSCALALSCHCVTCKSMPPDCKRTCLSCCFRHPPQASTAPSMRLIAG
jgi:hypothetical protein